MTPRLLELIEKARHYAMSPEEELEIRFAYSNAHIENPEITLEMVRDAIGPSESPMTTDRTHRILTALVTARALLRQSRRLSPHRTHKASSAESILKHVLRRRGWTAAFRRGELTDAQRLELLDDIRRYARKWMRHEAEVLFRAHGREKAAGPDDAPPVRSGGMPGASHRMHYNRPELRDQPEEVLFRTRGRTEDADVGNGRLPGDGLRSRLDSRGCPGSMVRTGQLDGIPEETRLTDGARCELHRDDDADVLEAAEPGDEVDGSLPRAMVCGDDPGDAGPGFRDASLARGEQAVAEVRKQSNSEDQGQEGAEVDVRRFQDDDGRSDSMESLDVRHPRDGSAELDLHLQPLDESISRALGQALAHHVRRFFTRAKSFIHEAIIAGAMALGGPEPLTAHDLAEADRQAHVQAQYLDRFEADAHFRTPAEIAEGEPPVEPMTAPQFGARAQSYGNAPYTAAQEIGRKASIRAGAIEQRRVHVGLDTPCVQCQEQQGFGWLPIGDPRFLQIGDCICITSCHCHVELRWPDGTIRWAGQSPKRAA